MTWRRRPRNQPHGADTRGRSGEEHGEQVWEESAAQWDRPEAERVAQWLRSKGAWTGQFDLDGWGDGGPDPYGEQHATAEQPTKPPNGESLWAVEDAPVANGAELVASRRTAEADLSTAPGTRQDVIHIEGAGLVDADLGDPRSEMAALEERSARLRAEVARLESRVRELMERAEEAGRAAERARLTEQEARADLEAVEAEARRREGDRIDIGAALGAEVAALERRRREFQGSE